ncbi:MAG: hypothetical protein ACYS22_04020 [Planctomycetota bacterium]|jgi:hypothetical protein
MSTFRTLALAGLLVMPAAIATAQGMPPMPTPEEIDQRIQAELDKLPMATVECEAFTIEHKVVPTDFLQLVKQAAGGQIPPGMNADQLAKQYLPMARPYIEKHLGKIGTLTAKKTVKLKSLKLKEGEVYDFGLLFKDMLPYGIQFAGGDLKKAARLPLKRGKGQVKVDPIVIEVVPDKKSDKKLSILVKFAEIEGVAGKFKVQ